MKARLVMWFFEGGIAVVLVIASGCSKNTQTRGTSASSPEPTKPLVAQVWESAPISVTSTIPVPTPEVKYEWLKHLPPAPTEAEVKARVPEIRTITDLLESGSLEAITKAMDLMDGRRPVELNDRERFAAQVFYNNYISAVIQHGDNAEKVQAARLLRAIVKAAALENGSDRAIGALWNLLAPVMQGDMSGGYTFVEPSEKWLESLPAYKLLIAPVVEKSKSR